MSVTILIFTLFMWPSALFVNGGISPVSQFQYADESSKYSCIVLQNDTGGWYYEVKVDKKTLIIQKNIPAISGNIAFADSVEASLVAGVVINKLGRGIFPPSMRVSEIDSLKINY